MSYFCATLPEGRASHHAIDRNISDALYECTEGEFTLGLIDLFFWADAYQASVERALLRLTKQ